MLSIENGCVCVIAPWQYVALLAIMSAAEPLGLLYHLGEPEMRRVAILIDGGYIGMRIGIDVASLTLKKQANTIILVAGDSDLVPAAKLARREGVEVILDPLWKSVHPDLHEHIDGLHGGFGKPKNEDAKEPEAFEAE